MLHTTRAIVLRTFKHSDKSTVLKACTEAFGTRSYAVRISQKGASRQAALQPLSRVELVVTESHERDMHTVREVRVERPYLQLTTEPVRGVLALFAQEVLYRALREESGDASLFAFVQDTLEAMDTGHDIALFPQRLLILLMRQLGVGPEAPAPGEERFDMREGYFFQGHAPHELCMEPDQAALLAALLDVPWSTAAPSATASARKKLLDDLLTYYRLHVPGFGELRSPAVLQALLS
jgi:DNA repair protein RecO (recombination protein O)